MFSPRTLIDDPRHRHLSYYSNKLVGRTPLRHPTSLSDANIAIIMIVVLPTIFFILMCVLICWYYRFKRKSLPRSRSNASTTVIDPFGIAMPTIIPNTQYNPFTIEDHPPSYDLISEVKKDSTLHEQDQPVMNSPLQNGEQLATSTTGSACFNVKEIERTLLMAIEASFGFYILLIQQILLRPSNADDLCYYLNQSSIIVPIRCPSDCCPGTATSPTTACCSQMSWSSFVVPIFVIGGVCLLAVCLVYIRPLLKLCFCGCRCPFGHRSRVSSSGIQSATNIPPTVMNNTDLPDYETVHKAPAPKDITPPPYNFVTAHPSDYGLEASFPSAPPQYRSRDNSAGSVRFHTRAES